ncbi:MAG: 1,4-alpha-glucan branching protein GlgB [Victivallaceae bacterium]
MEKLALKEDINLLLNGCHLNPHKFLGLHSYDEEYGLIVLYRPGASEVFIEVSGRIEKAVSVHSSGIFVVKIPSSVLPEDYKIYHQNGLLAHDPYACRSLWGEMDSFLFSKGVHYRIYEKLGARISVSPEGFQGVNFSVWAPNARRVSVIGDFNRWDGRLHPMRNLGECGVWDLFIPGLDVREKYKWEIITENGTLIVKSDPYALSFEHPPHTASVIDECETFLWEDYEWKKRLSETRSHAEPMNIYEVHLGSWKKQDGLFVNYRDLAHRLSEYCLKMSYTHIELLPVTEHPLTESWGYQTVGFYAPTSRYGSCQDFQYFVNHMHKHNIGVILDWVPGHFPRDDFALSYFDGTALYEHKHPFQAMHPHWGTHIFNYDRHEVSNFLLGSALFWIDKMHIDGLRVDAVSSMLYLDYGRNPGEWIPNKYGGKENLGAIEFLKHLNSLIHKNYPGTLVIAEESTAFPGVTTPVEYGGLGFDYKWNMGWMHDTLRYFSTDPIFRIHRHEDLTFGLLYVFNESFVLPLSHDEVVHGKKSLIEKMPGYPDQKFANLRLLLSYHMCQVGKKLFFMGGEFAQFGEWSVSNELDWFLLDSRKHADFFHFVASLNRFYISHPPLWRQDLDPEGFQWVDFSDSSNNVISYLRRCDMDYELLCVHNFSSLFLTDYRINLFETCCGEEIFNSDAVEFGAGGKDSLGRKYVNRGEGFIINIPPLSTVVIKITN